MRWRDHPDNHDGIDLDSIGLHFEVSRERIRQIERNALRKVSIALAIRECVGIERGHEIWEQLAGKSVREFEQALQRAMESS